MRENEVLKRAFATPLTNPAYPPGPLREPRIPDHHLPHRSGETAI